MAKVFDIPEARKFLQGVTYLCEADRYSIHKIWEENQPHLKQLRPGNVKVDDSYEFRDVNWTGQIGSVVDSDDGEELNNRPVTLSLWKYSMFDDYTIVFVEMLSELADHKMMKQFLLNHSACRQNHNEEYLRITDPNNFHHITHYVQDLIKQKAQETEPTEVTLQRLNEENTRLQQRYKEATKRQNEAVVDAFNAKDAYTRVENQIKELNTKLKMAAHFSLSDKELHQLGRAEIRNLTKEVK